MASTGAVGGSQIDVQSLVAQLVGAERSRADGLIARDSSRVTTQISAIGQLMGSMSVFRSALSSLKTVEVFSTRTAASSDVTMFKASASVEAVPGSYDIEVVKLAKAQQLSSDPFVGGSSSVVGTGTLTLSLGAESFSVVIASPANTLASVRDAINAAVDNTGIRATLVTGTTGSQLVLSSVNTGAASKITVAQSGGDGGLAQLAYSELAPTNYTVITPAQDAVVKIANAQTTSATNAVEGAIDGVTLTLLKETTVGEPEQLTVGYDSAAVTTRVNTFVTAYNALVAQIGKLRSYDPVTKVAGAMLGDSMLNGIESQLRRIISDPVAGQGPGFQTMANIGITTQADGTLAVDATKFQKALTTNFEAVGKLFGSDSGVAARLFKQADDRLKTDGVMESRSKTLVDQQKIISKRKDDLNARMLVIQSAYIRQFTALDTLLSRLQVTSSYMSQQIESMQNFNKL